MSEEIEYHKILQRQINKSLPESYRRDEKVASFLSLIDNHYKNADVDKSFSDHAFAVSEREYEQFLAEQREVNMLLSNSIQQIRQVITDLDPNHQTFPDNNSDSIDKIIVVLKKIVANSVHVEQNMKIIADSTSNFIIRADISGRITWVNKAFEKFTGYTLEEVIGKTPGSFLAGAETELDQTNLFRKAILELRQENIKITNYTKGGIKYRCNIQFTPIYDNSNNHIGFISIQQMEMGTELLTTRLADANKELIYQKKLYEEILDNIPVEIALLDMEKRYRFVNKAAIKSADIRSWIIGKNDLEYVSERKRPIDVAKQRMEYIEITMSGFQAPDWTEKQILADGSSKFVERRYFMQPGSKYVIGYGLDVTNLVNYTSELEIKNKELSESTELLDRTEKIAKIGRFKRNILTGEIIASAGLLEILGITEDKKIWNFRDYLRHVHEDDLAHFKYLDSQSEFGHVDFSKDYRMRRVDGSVIDIHSESFHDLNDDGIPVSQYGIMYDVTEMKMREAQILQSEKNFRMMMDQMPQYVFLKDEHGKIIYANDNYCKLYNISLDKIIGMDWQSYQMGADALEQVHEMDMQVIETNSIFKTSNFRYVDNNSIEHYFDIVKIPFLIDAINVKAILVIMTDNADRVRADHEKSKLLEEIVVRNRNLENFSYTISHNLRGPIATLLGVAEMIDSPQTSFDEKVYLLNEINTLVKKTDKTITEINDILALKNKNKGYSEVNLEESFKDIILSNNSIIRHRNISIKYELEAKCLNSVKSYISSIFNNLVSNAIKYCNKDTEPKINIKSYYLDNFIVIEVEDNGIGIDLVKYENDIFKLYKRFHVNAAEGTGVGLYLVKLQVDELMGSIKIESEPSKGTKFILKFKK